MATTPNEVQNVITSISGGVGTALIVYITVIIRKGARKYLGEHDYLIKQTKQNTEDIKKNSQDIRRILTIIERRGRFLP